MLQGEYWLLIELVAFFFWRDGVLNTGKPSSSCIRETGVWWGANSGCLLNPSWYYSEVIFEGVPGDPQLGLQETLSSRTALRLGTVLNLFLQSAWLMGRRLGDISKGGHGRGEGEGGRDLGVLLIVGSFDKYFHFIFTVNSFFLCPLLLNKGYLKFLGWLFSKYFIFLKSMSEKKNLL